MLQFTKELNDKLKDKDAFRKEFDMSKPSLQRLLTGITVPHTAIQKIMIEYLND